MCLRSAPGRVRGAPRTGPLRPRPLPLLTFRARCCGWACRWHVAADAAVAAAARRWGCVSAPRPPAETARRRSHTAPLSRLRGGAGKPAGRLWCAAAQPSAVPAPASLAVGTQRGLRGCAPRSRIARACRLRCAVCGEQPRCKLAAGCTQPRKAFADALAYAHGCWATLNQIKTTRPADFHIHMPLDCGFFACATAIANRRSIQAGVVAPPSHALPLGAPLCVPAAHAATPDDGASPYKRVITRRYRGRARCRRRHRMGGGNRLRATGSGSRRRRGTDGAACVCQVFSRGRALGGAARFGGPRGRAPPAGPAQVPQVARGDVGWRRTSVPVQSRVQWASLDWSARGGPGRRGEGAVGQGAGAATARARARAQSGPTAQRPSCAVRPLHAAG